MKIDFKGLWKTKRKLILGVTAGVTAAAVGCGVWFRTGRGSSDPVYVFPFNYIGMTEYWGDSQESNGPVTTDKIQTVFLSDTQTVTEILVQQGDDVKKGDLLLTYDTTMSDLQLERKRLDVEKSKLQLEDAKTELGRINSMKPMVIPEEEPEEPEDDPDLGAQHDRARLYPLRITRDLLTKLTYNGSAPEKALIYWVLDTTDIDNRLFAEAEEHAAYLQSLNQPEEPDPEEDIPEDIEVEEPDGEDIPEEQEVLPEEPEDEDVPPEEEEADEEELPPEEDEQIPSNASAEEDFELSVGDSFYVVIKITEGNYELGAKKIWQGLKVTKQGPGSYSFRFADARIPDYSVFIAADEIEEAPEVDLGSGYTAAQIAQMRSDQQKKIKDLEFQIKMAEAEYRIMEKEISDGNVYAEIDGQVVSLLTEDEAKQMSQPILKVSGGGGFYVEGFISELEKDNMKIGQEVTINDWQTGATYTGTVESIGDFPTRDGYYNGNGNPNASNYPFLVFVDGSADLREGSYVSVMYSNAESKNGIYLENPFLRTEKGQSYVYVMGSGGRLERRTVTLGKSLWGSYMEVLSGLTEEDLIAFPYGKNVRPGAAAVEGDLNDLYG